MRLYRQTVEDFGLYEGLELSQEQLKSLLCEKTGLLLERPGSLKTLSLSTLLKMKK